MSDLFPFSFCCPVLPFFILSKTPIRFDTGNYSRLVARIQFSRSLGFYLIQIYIPASLIVVISWVSFWLHRNATPARVSLGVTTVLTMTTLMSSTNSQLPKISYVKSIDVFLGTCFFLVFASLLEYATVGYLGKRIAMRKSRAEALAKAQEEQLKKLAAAASVTMAAQQQQPPPLPPFPQLFPLDESSPGLAQHLFTMNPQDSANELPPPIPPAPAETSIPMLTHYSSTRSPRQKSHPAAPGPHHPHCSGYRTSISASGTHYERCTGAKNVCSCQLRTNTPTHVLRPGPESVSVSMPGQQQQQPQAGIGSQQQQQQSGGQQLKMSMSSQEGRTMKDAPTPVRKDPRGVSIAGALMKPMPDRGFFSKTKKNPNKLLGISPSDVDKYSRVIFPGEFLVSKYFCHLLRISSPPGIQLRQLN